MHWGATSQDVIDTAFALVAAERLPACARHRRAAMQALETLVAAHRATVMPGRTLMQQALPITFAYKAAGWLSGLTVAAERLRRVAATSARAAVRRRGRNARGARRRRGEGPRRRSRRRLNLKEAPRSPGTRNAGASSTSPRRSPGFPAPAPRSRPMCSCSCRARSARPSSRPPPARAAPPPCRTSAIRSARSPIRANHRRISGMHGDHHGRPGAGARARGGRAGRRNGKRCASFSCSPPAAWKSCATC